jgi:hypothetical protein
MMKLTQVQLAAIRALENPRGQITATAVVQAARPTKSPLHDLFDWNVKVAAEKWWLHRARVIIGAVTIQVTTQEFTYNASAYVVDTTVEGQGYRSVVALKSDSESARESLVYTLEMAAGHLRRAFDLAAPLGLADEIDHLLQQIAGVRRVLTSKVA